jgi:putative tryptophan/tyrosine transport system substrate-binding protein
MTAEALRVTSTVPIVFPAVDPITAGLVTALGRRDRNITGMMGTGPQLEGKRLEVLPEALPKTRRVAVLEQPSS